jgi:hypothetical protein
MFQTPPQEDDLPDRGAVLPLLDEGGGERGGAEKRTEEDLGSHRNCCASQVDEDAEEWKSPEGRSSLFIPPQGIGLAGTAGRQVAANKTSGTLPAISGVAHVQILGAVWLH